jgi:ABC-type bacteriocin/lantibiotic exporter with double-glycine peptidase domain
MSQQELIQKEIDRINEELEAHNVFIQKYYTKLAEWKRINKFVNTGTIVSILMTVLAALAGYESIEFASTIITLICIILMLMNLIAMFYYDRKIGKRYNLMNKVLLDSIEGTEEWVKSQTT